jgi:NTP pyrophosphatase (non-canonical NTP hydrolase)
LKDLDGLTFAALREGNLARQAHWGGSENWTLADWSNAMAGEAGEACNVVKKIRRVELGTTGNKNSVSAYSKQLETEIGDVMIYLDLLANAAGFSLENCVRRAFNEKSDELNMPVRI